LKIQSQNKIPTYENNVISNTIHLNHYYIFCDQNASIFLFWNYLFFKINFLSFFFFFWNNYSTFSPFKFFFSFLVLNYFLLLFITISLFLLLFSFFIIIIFSLNIHILCPTFGYYTNHPKKSAKILCFKGGYYKIILTKLMFILWPLCKYFTLNFIFLKFSSCNNVTLQYVSNSYF
jgi:hypothetical protein